MWLKASRFWGHSLPLFISLFLAFAFLVAEGYEFFAGNQPATVWSIFIAFGIFILGERLKAISDFFAEQETEEIRTKNLQDLKALLTSRIEVRRLGSPVDGLKYITSAISSTAVYVRDVMFRANVNASYSKEIHADFERALRPFLDKGNRYIVVGNNNGLSIGNEIRMYPNRRNFLVKSNEFNFPIINFVIIAYREKKEVLFGWDYDRAHMAQVFISEDLSLVSHFEGVFASALEHSTEWQPPPIENKDEV